MDEEKQAELQKAIEKLALESNIAEGNCQEEYIEKFKGIYTNGFRHLYSGIFGLITNLNEEQRVNLEQGLSLIQRKAESRKCDENLCKSIRKLHDHISLDISRINYWNALCREYDDRFKEAGKGQVELDDKVAKQKKKIYKLVKRLEKAKNEYITILGIFAAIILGAAGSLAYAGKVIGCASEPGADLTKLIIISVVLGAVLVSVVHAFLSFILKINSSGEQFKGWRWNECIALILLSGLAAIVATKLLGL